MFDFGEKLKAYRDRSGFSMKQVNEATGITNSRLSKIERGQIECPPQDLRKLAQLYDIQIIILFIEAGYLQEDDVKDYQFVFTGVSELDDTEKEHIQLEIDFINKRKGVSYDF